jgi:hypothetical protein
LEEQEKLKTLAEKYWQKFYPPDYLDWIFNYG